MQRKRVYHLRLSREGISSPLVKKEVRELEERGIPHGDHHGTRQRGYRALYCPQKRGNFRKPTTVADENVLQMEEIEHIRIAVDDLQIFFFQCDILYLYLSQR